MAHLGLERTRNHITLKVADDTEEGYIGAVVTTDKDADGCYYLIKWTGSTDQESGKLVCPVIQESILIL